MKIYMATILFVYFFLVVYGCNTPKEPKCISTETAVVDSATGPGSGRVNIDNLFNVYFGIGNGCGKFTGFTEYRKDNIITVSVKLTFEGCMCTEVYQMAKETYRFKAQTPGKYTVQFIRGNMNATLQKEIVIQ